MDILTNPNDLDSDCEACFFESSNGLVSHGFSTVSCANSSWGAPGVSSDSFKVASIFLCWIYLQLQQETSLGECWNIGGGLTLSLYAMKQLIELEPHHEVPGT